MQAARVQRPFVTRKRQVVLQHRPIVGEDWTFSEKSAEVLRAGKVLAEQGVGIVKAGGSEGGLQRRRGPAAALPIASPVMKVASTVLAA